MKNDDLINEEDYRVVKVLKALSNGLRFEIVRVLMEAPHSVTELSDRLNRSASSISHHLDTLGAENLVRSKTDGNHNIYRPKRRDVIKKIFELRSLLKREEK